MNDLSGCRSQIDILNFFCFPYNEAIARKTFIEEAKAMSKTKVEDQYVTTEMGKMLGLGKSRNPTGWNKELIKTIQVAGQIEFKMVVLPHYKKVDNFTREKEDTTCS